MGSEPGQPSNLNAVTDAQDLVDGAQILLYGGLGEPQSPGYLSVGEPFDQEPQDLPLASGKYAQISLGNTTSPLMAIEMAQRSCSSDIPE
jgi:hypothetical protein